MRASLSWIFAMLFAGSSSLLLSGNPISVSLFPLRYIAESIRLPSESEIAELELLDCLRESANVISDGNKASVLVSKDDFLSASQEYLTQRMDELLFPRLRIVEVDANYEILLVSQSRLSGSEIVDIEATRIMDTRTCQSVGIVIKSLLEAE